MTHLVDLVTKATGLSQHQV